MLPKNAQDLTKEEARAAMARIMRAATRPGDPEQLDLFLDHLKDQDRVEEIPTFPNRTPGFNREWRFV